MSFIHLHQYILSLFSYPQLIYVQVHTSHRFCQGGLFRSVLGKVGPSTVPSVSGGAARVVMSMNTCRHTLSRDALTFTSVSMQVNQITNRQRPCEAGNITKHPSLTCPERTCPAAYQISMLYSITSAIVEF